MGEYILSC